MGSVDPTAPLPLSDIRVVDLTIARAGPQCVRQLADWGADVVRVEPPSDPAGVRGSDARNLHRNKRTVQLDLKTDAAVASLLRMIDRADVLVENMRPSVKHKLGFGWDIVHARNPRLVYGSISGFGQDGPVRGSRRCGPDRAGHGRADERHRIAADRTDASRHPRQRSLRGTAPRDRHPRRAARAGAHRCRADGCGPLCSRR